MRQGPDSPDRSISVLVSGLCGDLGQDACASGMNQFAVRGTQVTAEACRSIHSEEFVELEGRVPGLSTQLPGERGEAHPRLEALRRCAERLPGPISFLHLRPASISSQEFTRLILICRTRARPVPSRESWPWKLKPGYVVCSQTVSMRAVLKASIKI